MFPIFSWSVDRGEEMSFVCSVGAGGEVAARVEGDAVITHLEVNDRGSSGVSFLLVETSIGARKRDSAFSMISIS